MTRGGVRARHTDIKMFTPLKNIPRFYQEVILSYNKSKILRNEDFYNNIRNHTIWYNKYIKFKGETLIFKNWIKDGVILVKNLKLNNGILDISYLSRVIKDKRRFYRDINILQKALRSAKINISIEPVKDANIPTHSHHNDEEYNWSIKKSKFYYNHLVEEIL